jgi:hypothetical protein
MVKESGVVGSEPVTSHQPLEEEPSPDQYLPGPNPLHPHADAH